MYGHDYAQEGQREELPREDALSSPNSSREGMAEGPVDPQRSRSGNVPNSDETSEDHASQEQPLDGDLPLFPETIVQRKHQPRETEFRSPPHSKSAAGGTGNERADRERMPQKRYHYRNPPMWTTPSGLILIGWRMRCPFCYHQDGHSATCSERRELLLSCGFNQCSFTALCII